MEHLPKETLLTIINDLNNQISEKNNQTIKDLKDQLYELKQSNGKLRKVNDQLRKPDCELQKQIQELERELDTEGDTWGSMIDDREKEIKNLKDTIIEKDLKIFELAAEISKLQNTDSNSVSSDDTNTNKWNMTNVQKKNMMRFLKEQTMWCDENEHKVIDCRDGRIYEVAPSSVRDLHAHFRKWAQSHNIKTKGENRGIPVEPDFQRYLVYKHKQRFPHIPWRCSESKNQFPKFYNGSHSTPRISLKIRE
jgi:DNA-binding transcriptional MerR regulator